MSSGDLVQQFEATWSPEQLATHRQAAEALYRIKDRAFAAAAAALQQGAALTEYALQQDMVRWFEEEGLVSDSAPVVAIGGNAGNPALPPDATQSRPIVADEVLLLDLWGKCRTPGAVFADITWVGMTASAVPDEVARAFRAIVDARDAAVAVVVGRGTGRWRAARMGGRPGGPVGAGACRLRRPHPASDRP